MGGFFEGLGAIAALAKLALVILDYFGIRADNTRKWLAEVVEAQGKTSEPTRPADDEGAQEAELKAKHGDEP
jgi:hypothetical protein